MTESLHPKFRGYRGDYLRSQAVWEDVFHELTTDTEDIWESNWVNDALGDGSCLFSKIDRARRIGIIIDQILPQDDTIHFRAFEFTFDSDGDQPIHCLRIVAVLTEA